MAKESRVNFSRVAVRLMFAAGTAVSIAGCSDASRFAENPFSDPFGGSSRSVDRAPTGSLTKPRNDTSIQSRPLPPPAAGPSASYAPSAPRPAEPAPVPAQMTAKGGSDHWSAEGGAPVVLAQGETVAMLASRYGVPTDALLRVNGFSSAQQVRPGARLVIPVYRAVSGSKPALARSAEAPKPFKTASSERSVRDEKLARNAQAHADTTKSSLAKKDEEKAKPAIKTAKAEQPAKFEKLAKSEAAAERSEPARTEKTDKTATASIPRAEEKDTASGSDAAHPEFRWPARGRIIQGFTSGGNDGINISVPEGTQVKAAEGGVVAYAGNELKGYGNLVLIRHPNGFVTAYAHNGQLDVKRGDQVKRGQTIARSGQSGNVASPQLHFELRKGSTPVDPTSYLAGL
jgi:murein DD-endopeptidase MepM/ murein hydrolase activator NlpD